MSKITLEPNESGAGTFSIVSPATNINRTLTLPDASGTVARTESLIGQVCFFAMGTAPDGFLKANGAAVSRTTFSALFDAIGTTFGAGDGSTTFNLPDMRGEFPRGWDDGRGVDSGRNFGSAQLDQMQRIIGNTGSTRNNGTSHGADPIGRGFGALVVGNTNGDNGHNPTSGRHTVRFDFDSANSPDARASSTTDGETRSRNIALLACIKF